MKQSSRKICFVINDYNWQTDTHYRHLYRLIEEIAKHRDICILVETPFEPQAGGPLDDRVVVQRQRNPMLRIVEEFRLLLNLRRKGYRTFYVHYSKYGGILASIIARFSGGKTYYWHCEEVMKYRNLARFSLDYAWKWLRTEGATAISMYLAHRVITGNEIMVRHYQQAFGLHADKLTILPNYLDPDDFSFTQEERKSARKKFGFSAEAKVILFVHRLAERKGAHYLPEIVQRVVTSFNSGVVEFLIVGDGPYRSQLEIEFAQRGLNDRIQLVGAVPNREIGAYYAASDIFIMPSDVEGFPHVLLESMTSGLPCVATDVGGVSQLLQGAQLQFVVPPADVALFGQKIIELIKSPTICQALSRLGCEVAARYTIKVVSKRFFEIMDNP